MDFDNHVNEQRHLVLYRVHIIEIQIGTVMRSRPGRQRNRSSILG
jgi:hypothetical protein